MTPEEIKKKAAELQTEKESLPQNGLQKAVGEKPSEVSKPANSADPATESKKQTPDANDEKSQSGSESNSKKAPKDTSAKSSTQKKEKDFISTIYFGNGINLVPILSDEEEKLEEKKLNFNYFGAFVLLFLAILALVLIGIKAYNQSELSNEKSSLAAAEKEFRGKSDIIQANNSILRRVDLYQNIEAATFSPKEALLYWQELFGKFGTISKIELTSGLNFQISGSASNLTEVSRLWHLLSVDERVARVNLDSVDTAYVDETTSGKKASYTFTGELNFDYFSSEALRPQ
ncbi:hypothetical protein KC622_02915 [Candidatus Dojkabacteria bacterium]|uniref:PilN domain-containing protein n=1 Tax=Candidatus Dojkabacteria bacterium TaxID=2099670 RepID=A0A955HYA3_9BACT|nr:hypothetical protein [Candidatus Dojkabacteria bacterium]